MSNSNDNDTNVSNANNDDDVSSLITSNKSLSPPPSELTTSIALLDLRAQSHKLAQFNRLSVYGSFELNKSFQPRSSQTSSSSASLPRIQQAGAVTHTKQRNSSSSSNKVQLNADKFAKEEDLNKMSSTEIEEYINTHQGILEMSTDYQRKVKRIRRAIKNREYAQSSRNRRKESFDELEREVKAMHEQVSVLLARNVELERENATLKDAIEKLKATSNVHLPSSSSSSIQSQSLSNVNNEGLNKTNPSKSSTPISTLSSPFNSSSSSINNNNNNKDSSSQPSTTEILHSKSQSNGFLISSCLL